VNAYRLPTGELLIPKTLKLAWGIGDGWALVGPGTDEHRAWRAFAVPASKREVDIAMRLRAQQAGQESR
jgi:hypothetical protein